MQAVILCAGFGTRLRPLTDTVPKPMMPIASGKPLLEHTIEFLRDQGIADFVINLHYLSDVITSHFGDGRKFGARIVYSHEKERPLETGGGLKQMAPLLDDNFVFMYGDDLHFYNFAPAVDFHLKQRALGTIIAMRPTSPGFATPQDAEILEGDPITHQIAQWHIRPHGIHALNTNQAFHSGLAVYAKKITDFIPAAIPVKLDGEVIPPLVAQRAGMYAFPMEQEVYDIGKPEKYALAKKVYAEHAACQVANKKTASFV